jgi:hypothetical protein
VHPGPSPRPVIRSVAPRPAADGATRSDHLSTPDPWPNLPGESAPTFPGALMTTATRRVLDLGSGAPAVPAHN